MAICARERACRSGSALRPAFWATGALAAISAVLAAGCGGDEPLTSVAIAVRTDGGSPSLSTFAGDLENNPIELPPGTYFIEAVNQDDDIISFGEMEAGEGEVIGIAHFSGGTNDPPLGDAIRTTANFLIDVEVGRLGVLETMSGDYSTNLFDPEVQPTGEELQAFFDSTDALVGQEEAFLEALSMIGREMQVRNPVLYADASPSPPRDAFTELLDHMQADFFVKMKEIREQEREEILKALEMAPVFGLDTQRFFAVLPARMKGTATDYADWARRIENGDMDDRLGLIHSLFTTDAGIKLAKAMRSTSKKMVEASAPLVGADVSATTHGKAPGVYKAADLTALTKKWTEYARQFYGDGSSDPNQQKKDRDQLEQLIQHGLSGLAPGLSQDVLDSLAHRISGDLVSAISSLKNGSPTPTVSDEQWIEEITQTVADKLLAGGESGIDTAVVTDDLRQCLRGELKAGLTRNQALFTCQALENSPAWLDEMVSNTQQRLMQNGVGRDEALEQAVAYGNCLRSRWLGTLNREESIAYCESVLGEATARPTPTSTPPATADATTAPTPTCNADPDGDHVITMDDLTNCLATPAPTPCSDSVAGLFDPLCGLSQ